MMRYPTCFKAPRRAALSVSLSAAFGLVCASASPVPLLAAQQTQTFTAPRPTVTANDHLVTSCLDDNSPGTLRTVLADPTVVSGDSINLSQLACSTITLGAPLRVNRDALQFNGPSNSELIITGGGYSDVIEHFGYGELKISHLTVSGGVLFSGTSPTGACIWSRGSVYLEDSSVTSCSLASLSSSVSALGAGIYAGGDLKLVRSTISNNVAASFGAHAYGGGAFVKGDFQASYSTIEGNGAFGFYGGVGAAGGIYVHGVSTIESSTIANNAAEYAGAMQLSGTAQQPTSTITNSTISGNAAFLDWAGIWSSAPLEVANSTIAFNLSRGSNANRAGGLQATASLKLASSIIADNVNASGPSDLGATSLITGSKNLVFQTTPNTQTPADTISDCPRLDPLTKTVGPTASHLPRHLSPAIDQGDAGTLTSDQRGESRTAGAAADIGSVERQPADADERIMSHSFEGPCDV